jgi:hypothetical protein
MPDCFRRDPTKDLQPASITPEPTNNPSQDRRYRLFSLTSRRLAERTPNTGVVNHSGARDGATLQARIVGAGMTAVQVVYTLGSEVI